MPKQNLSKEQTIKEMRLICDDLRQLTIMKYSHPLAPTILSNSLGTDLDYDMAYRLRQLELRADHLRKLRGMHSEYQGN